MDKAVITGGSQQFAIWTKSECEHGVSVSVEFREDLFAWMGKKGYAFIPSEANMVLIDGKRPGREVTAAMLKEKVAIGRTWAALPNHVRVTIGTRDEMAKFKAAFERVMAS